MRKALEKWVVSFMHGFVRSGLIETVVYQVYARKFGFFCSLEKIKDENKV